MTVERITGSKYAEYCEGERGYVIRIVSKRGKKYDGYVYKRSQKFHGCGYTLKFATLEEAEKWLETA